MELKAKAVAGFVFHPLDLAGRAARRDEEAFRDHVDFVVVRFPNGLGLLGSGKDGAPTLNEFNFHGAKFRLRGLSSVAAVVPSHELVAGADAQDGDVEFKVCATISELSGQTDARRAAGKNQAVQLAKFRNGRGVVDDLRVHLEVAEHAPLPVRPLTPVVDDVNDEWFLRHASHCVAHT